MRAVGHAPARFFRRLIGTQVWQLAERGKAKDGKQSEGPHIGEQVRQRADDLVGEGCQRQMETDPGGDCVLASGDCIHGLRAWSNVVLRPVLA